MNVAMVLDLDEVGHDELDAALFELGADMVIELGTGDVTTPMAACDHPWTRIDGEYLKCGVCGTIVGSSGQ